MLHYNEIYIENTTVKKNNRKQEENKNFRQNPNYTNIIFPNYTSDGIFV